MGKASKYASKVPDENGYIHYTDEENDVWRELITRQKPMLAGRVCQEYLDALELMNFPEDRVPQTEEVSRVLREHTGWEVAAVPALINFTRFFDLLADKRFPCATFIRSREEMEYLQEPDIFHEVFGHTPLLTHPSFAEFTHAYGLAGQKAPKELRPMLARLYWFTVEFGLIGNSDADRRAYGAGLCSSIGELKWAVESGEPEIRPFDPIDILRTPYRIDIFQPVYFRIESFDDLFRLAHEDVFALIDRAKALGMHAPKFPEKESA